MTSVEPRRDHDWIMARAAEMQARGATDPKPARDPVNQAYVNTWLDAIGDTDPRWTSGEAPPAMAQVWTMPGLVGKRSEDDPLHGMMTVLDEAGFTSVLGTNCDQTYLRTLRIGEEVTLSTELESVVGPKRTGVGTGYFVTTLGTWRVGDETVATMTFRVLKYDPATAPPRVDRSRTVRPMVNQDTAFFWEGTRCGELRIQQCKACGALRHPPGPVCPECLAMDRGFVVASGRGTVASYVVHHAPPIPGKRLPLVLAVVELEEGVRMIGELRGVDPAEVEIGVEVRAVMDRIDDELVLPAFAVSTEGASSDRERDMSLPQSDEATSEASGEALPTWDLPITTTLVVSTALATRDFQDVHHDPELARMRGSRDIFLNILTTTGLVQRYVTAWAGQGAQVRSCELRLGAPAHPGDTLSFSGEVTEVVEVDGETRHVVDVVGTVSLGDHVTARVTVVKP